MSQDLDLNIRLRADGSGLQGAVNSSRQELDRLSGTTRASSNNFRQHATISGQTQQGMERLQSGMLGVRDSMNLINGPLNGISGRFTALSSILNKNNLMWVGLGLSVGAAGFAMQRGIQIAMNAERQQLRLAAILKATGHTVGFTNNQLEEYAHKVSLATMASTEGVRNAMGILLTFKSVTGKQFKDAISLSQDLAEVMGNDITSGAMLLGKALEDPINGLAGLKRGGISFLETEKDLIKSLYNVGQGAEAQRLILKKLAEQVGGAGAGASQGLSGSVDTLTERWEELLKALAQTGAAEKAKDFIDTVANGLHRLNRLIDPNAKDLQNKFNELIGVRENIKARMQNLETNPATHQIGGAAAALERERSLLKSVNAEIRELAENKFKLQEEEFKAYQKKGAEEPNKLSHEFAKSSVHASYNNLNMNEDRKAAEQAERAKTLSASSYKATEQQLLHREKLQQKAAATHEKSIKRIYNAQLSLMPAYARTEARAKQWRQETLDGLNKTGAGYGRLALEVENVFQQRIAQAMEQNLQASDHWAAGASRAFKAYADEAGNAAKNWEAVTSRALSGIEDAFVQLNTTGKLNIKDLVGSVLADISRLMIRQQVMEPMSKMLSGVVGNIAGGLMGGGGGELPLWMGQSGVGVYHTGGVVGMGGSKTRTVSTNLFTNASRMHSGGMIGPGEVPIIAKRGEGVFTPEQMAAMAPVGGSGGGGQVINQTINIDNSGNGGGEESEQRLAMLIKEAASQGAEQGYAKVFHDINTRGPIARKMGR